MDKNQEIISILEEIFNRRWDEDLTEDEEILIENKAQALIDKYSWEKVFELSVAYLHSKCTTPEAAVNFACNFWSLGWQDNPIPNPHLFLGYFYHCLNFETSKYDEIDILDSLAITILPRQGSEEANLFKHPYYMPEQDPKIILAAKSYQK